MWKECINHTCTLMQNMYMEHVTYRVTCTPNMLQVENLHHCMQYSAHWCTTYMYMLTCTIQCTMHVKTLMSVFCSPVWSEHIEGSTMYTLGGACDHIKAIGSTLIQHQSSPSSERVGGYYHTAPHQHLLTQHWVPSYKTDIYTCRVALDPSSN